MAETIQGVLVPTTDTFDFSRLEGKSLDSPEFRTFITRLTNRINLIASVLNQKDTGNYILTEYVCSKSYFPDPTPSVTGAVTTARSVYRKVLNCGPLLGAGITLTVPHGIANTPGLTLTLLEGFATDTTGLTKIPIPFVSVTGNITAGNIEIYMDQTNVYITATGDATNYDTCYVTIEVIKT